MLSQDAQNYVFSEGELANKRPFEMLNNYLVIQYMHYLIKNNWSSEKDKNIYKELIEFASNIYPWVNYIVNEKKIQPN